MLAALGAIGHGVEAAAYSQVDNLPYGWRALYAFGALPVLLIPFFMRRVSETARFQRGQLERSGADVMSFRSVWEPLRALSATHPGRALGVAATGFASSAAIAPSFQFSSYFTQIKLGWEPQHYSLLLIAGGGIGLVGNIAAGILGDRFGRRRVGFALLAGFPASSLGFYHGQTTIVVVAWVGLVFCSMGGRVILRALATELFPTSHRASASGLFAALDTLGAVAGLLAVFAFGTRNIDDIALAVPAIAVVVLAAGAVLLAFPETRQRELEELSGG
jgi:putative MFS transporter